MPVEIVTLAAKPVEQISEFVGTVKSRRSTNIQPQVEGFITRIAVKSGDRVARRRAADGDRLALAAGGASPAWSRCARSARSTSPTRSRKPTARRSCSTPAPASQMDADRAANALKAAEAQLRTVEEQIRQLRTDLAYYHVTAPTAGIVGDIPVHEGDRVTKTTLLTTIDAQRGPRGVPQRSGAAGAAAEDRAAGAARRRHGQRRSRHEAINFVSPSVDTATQTVLAKVPLTRRRRGFRTVAVRARAGDLDHRAGPDGSGDGGDAHQRPVLRLRRRSRAQAAAVSSRISARSRWAAWSATTTWC